MEKESDKTINTTVWLVYDKLDHDHVALRVHPISRQDSELPKNLSSIYQMLEKPASIVLQGSRGYGYAQASDLIPQRSTHRSLEH